MNYDLEYADEASADLNAVPLELRGAVEAKLSDLAASPTSLSHPLVYPYAPPGQLFPFDLTTAEGATRRFTVVFLFGQDEQVLLITRIIYHQPN